MSTFLEISLILASLAIVVFVGMCIPFILFAKKKMEHFADANDQLQTNINQLIGESREMIRQISQFTERADTELKEVSQVVHTVQEWADKANGVVDEVKGFVEPVVQNFTRFRAILSAVSQIFTAKKLPQSS